MFHIINTAQLYSTFSFNTTSFLETTMGVRFQFRFSCYPYCEVCISYMLYFHKYILC